MQYASSMSAISTAKQTFLTQQLMPAAILFFQQTLKVYPVSGNLFVSWVCSSGSYYSSPGVLPAVLLLHEPLPLPQMPFNAQGLPNLQLILVAPS